jgi:tetratricopeptide (TPR) repeat protein
MNIEPSLLRCIGWLSSLWFQLDFKAGIRCCLGLTFSFLSGFPLVAQTNQEVQVAQVYLEQGELEKAQSFYERFYQQRPDRHVYFTTLIQIYIGLEKIQQAEALLDKHHRKYPDIPEVLGVYVDFHLRFGKPKLAEKAMKQWNRNMPANFRSTEELANLLATKGHGKLAIQVVEDWQRQNGRSPLALYKLVDFYISDNQPEMAATQLIQLLKVSISYYEGVKTRLVNLLAEEADAPVNMAIKQAFIAELQKNPDETEFATLLMWIFIHEANFSQAFIHAKAIDQRNGSEGRLVLDLGMICQEQQAYEVANSCFSLVAGLGEQSPYYIEARIAEVQNMEDWLRWDGRLTGEQLLQLSRAYQATLKVLPSSSNSAQLMVRYARLMAFDLNQQEEAIVLLQSAINEFRPGSIEEARVKIALADILIATGDLWEPSLLYGQVEKALPNTPEGHEAKWGNTRLSFFRAEFPWAQTQAKVLKASTTKHIANDALGLSLLMNDLLAEDSNVVALASYARAECAFYSRNMDQAVAILDSLESTLNFGPILTASRWIRYQILERKGQFEEAIAVLKILIKNDPESLLVDDAWLAMARLYENQLNQVEKAMEAYRTLLLEHSGSLHNQTARIRYRVLKSQLAGAP